MSLMLHRQGIMKVLGGAPPAWTPADITTSLWYTSHPANLWLDTAGTSPVTTDGDLVARRDDLSGTGMHLIQATSAARPVYRTSGGLHWLEYDGTDDHLRRFDNNNIPTFNNIAGITVIQGAQVSSSNSGANKETWGAYDGGGTFHSVFRILSGNGTLRYGVRRVDAGTPTFIDLALTTNANFVFTGHADYAGTNLASFQINNGTASTASMAGSGNHAATADMDILFTGGNTTSYAGRDYGVIVAPLLSGGDLTSAKTWMGNECGLSI